MRLQAHVQQKWHQAMHVSVTCKQHTSCNSGSATACQTKITKSTSCWVCVCVVAAASSQQQQQGSLVRKLRLAHIQLPLDKQQQLDELEQQLKGE
jgi:hypothetical protein